MKSSTLVIVVGWLMLASLLLIGACGTGEVQTYRPTSYPVYQRPYYYPDLRYREDDPEFWPMWQNSQGGG